MRTRKSETHLWGLLEQLNSQFNCRMQHFESAKLEDESLEAQHAERGRADASSQAGDAGCQCVSSCGNDNPQTVGRCLRGGFTKQHRVAQCVRK
eukprot:6165960-Amphidinium_carterae.4